MIVLVDTGNFLSPLFSHCIHYGGKGVGFGEKEIDYSPAAEAHFMNEDQLY